MPAMAIEAEILHLCAVKHLPPPMADEMELWEIAAYLGLHRVETVEAYANREIVEAKQEYWEETESKRLEHLAGYSERRRARAIERRAKKARS